MVMISPVRLVCCAYGAQTLERRSVKTALQGAGGYGKTTLAIALCHDDRVIDAFDDGILWFALGQHPNVNAGC